VTRWNILPYYHKHDGFCIVAAIDNHININFNHRLLPHVGFVPRVAVSDAMEAMLEKSDVARR
jgi:hypothetical protein